MRFRIMPLLGLAFFLVAVTGCQSPAKYRIAADRAALDIIAQKQKEALGKTGPFGIERPSDILRRRLLQDQKLPYSGPASLGADRLVPIKHWPEKEYLETTPSMGPGVLIPTDSPLKLSLLQSLQVGAQNSFEYQTEKEKIFQAALELDLEEDAFKNTFIGQMESLLKRDGRGDERLTGTENSGSIDLSKKLKSGLEFSTAIAVNLANLLTPGKASSLGITADMTISIPLLRGAGRHIVTESLTQAERDVVYAIYEFERFKKTFAVDVARAYLETLKQLDRVKNAGENYRSVIASARRSRRLADAGRIPEIEVDQTVQSELRARDRWISVQLAFQNQLDSFKTLLGLPPDAKIELDRSDLELLLEPAVRMINKITQEEKEQPDKNILPADAPIELIPPDRENPGPLEMDESGAILLALENRLDLKIAEGKIYDAQRAVVAAADATGAELTLFGSAGLGENRAIATADREDARLKSETGRYSAWLALDLPFERTAERNKYRNSLIALEQQVREAQQLEDAIKLSIRGKLRDLLQARESLQIQAKSGYVAEKRVKSVNLFLEAGRAQMRDLLEAQEALLSAQN